MTDHGAALTRVAVAAAIALMLPGCNAIWGIDELSFHDQGGGGSQSTTSGSGGTASSGVGGAAGGANPTGAGGGAAGAGGSVEQSCGNGIAEGTEQCDDGDTTSGDGCSASCQVECVPLAFMDPNTFHCYVTPSIIDDWYAAQDNCNSIGLHLVTFTSSAELAFVQSQLPSYDPAYYWIGARDTGSGYQWETGEPFSFNAWHPAEPDPNLCAFSSRSVGQWFTGGCGSNDLYWVCEQDPAGW